MEAFKYSRLLLLNTSLIEYYAGGWNELSSLFHEVFLTFPYMPWSLVTNIYFTNIYLTMIMRGSCYHDVSYYDFVGFPYLYSWNNEFLHNTTHINSISCVNLLLMNAKISVQYFYPECYFSVCDTFMLETNIFQKQIFIFFRVT